MATPRSLRAVVVGGSGAIGKCLLGELTSSPNFSEVVSLGRREVAVPERYRASGDKLKQESVDFDLEKFTVESSKSYFEEKDVLFCTLGTTRSAASQQPGNTTENVRRIDVHLVVRCAQIAKAAGVPHVSLVTSQGASATSWISYMRMKAEAENGVQELGFDRVAIWRPGLLKRGSDARFVEKFFGLFMKSMPVEDVACAMRLEAEQWAFKQAEFEAVSRYENRAIWDFCQVNAQLQASVSDPTSALPTASSQQEPEQQEAPQEGTSTAQEESSTKQEPEQKPTDEDSQPGGDETAGGEETKAEEPVA